MPSPVRPKLMMGEDTWQVCMRQYVADASHQSIGSVSLNASRTSAVSAWSGERRYSLVRKLVPPLALTLSRRGE